MLEENNQWPPSVTLKQSHLRPLRSWLFFNHSTSQDDLSIKHVWTVIYLNILPYFLLSWSWNHHETHAVLLPRNWQALLTLFQWWRNANVPSNAKQLLSIIHYYTNDHMLELPALRFSWIVTLFTLLGSPFVPSWTCDLTCTPHFRP